MASTATSESTFFAERDEAFGLIDLLSALPASPSYSPTSSADGPAFSAAPDEALSKLRSILDKYLECPTLLDPHLEGMVRRLSLPARDIVRELFLLQSASGIVGDGRDNDEGGSNGAQKDDAVHKLDTLMHLFSAIYAISKVRGRKYIQRLMPHEAADVEPVLVMLRWFGWMESRERPGNRAVSPREDAIPDVIREFQKKQKERGDNAEAKGWESVHTLLTWLGILGLVPFDLHTIDSSLGNELSANEGNDGNATPTTLVQSILATSAFHLGDYGSTRETAAACLASLLSRPDLEHSELEGFVNWSAHILYWFRTTKKMSENDDGKLLLPMPQDPPSIFLIMGVLQTLAAIFKSGHRSNLLSTRQKLRGIEGLWEQCIVVAEGSAVSGSMILRKLLVKLFARVGCAYLPPRVAAWRYQRGKRSLVENLQKGSGSGAQAESGASANGGSNDESHSAIDALFPIPDQVEDAMDQLLRSLTDSATIVRWSAAKGIGRLTERLPALCADDVLDAILQTCADVEQDRAWHGACLALAELARRGLLLPERLGEVVPILVQAIGYDVRRGQHSVGAHVRDAACYLCWAFARAYSPSVLRPHVKELSAALVLASLFDREVNCRRAASAAFQESVGRQGADNFPHGIAILTTADYYSLGNRNEAFTSLALDIAGFEEYQTPIIRHLSQVKLIHWDVDVRSLASKSLSRITRLNPQYVATGILPKLLDQGFHDDLVVRHGSLLGVAEIVLAFGEANLVRQGNVLNDDAKSQIAELVPSVEKARLYRGRGGEIMRSAACRMIECVSFANLPLTVKQQVRLMDSVDACLVHPNEDIQQSAALALNALLMRYFPVSSKGPSERLQGRVVDKYISIVRTEDNPAATRGFSLALGYLPAKLLAPSSQVLDSVLGCLSHSAKRDSLVGGEGDAETRRNAVKSLVNVCTTVGICKTSSSADDAATCPIHHLTKDQTDRVLDTLLAAMEDYNTDRRGDVGSWCRLAAMDGLTSLAMLTIDASTTFPHSTGPDLDVGVIVAPPFDKRLEFLASRAVDDARGNTCRSAFFDERLCRSILGALLKQLAEKLDVVRSKAGECLERLLTSQTPRLPFVPHRRILLQALGLDGRGKNWADPALTFPLLMKVVNIEDFTEPILSGVVVSVGGLTESVSKSASASLFEWIRGVRIAKATPKLVRMGEVFLGLFKRHKRNGRVLLPLLSTLDKLLTHGYLDELLTAQNGTFLRNLVDCLSNEAKGCSDVKRLLAIVGVSLNLLQPHLETQEVMQKEILPFVMAMLLNRFPRVRRYTAEQLYVKLSEEGDALFGDHGRLEEANQLLLSTVWHEERDPEGKLTNTRNRIADLLDIPLTTDVRELKIGKRATTRSAPKDEFESYASLLADA